MDAALAIVDKRRVEMNVAEVMHVIGDVKGRTCLMIDDLIDTAGTLVKTAAALCKTAPQRFMLALRTRCFRIRRWKTLRSLTSGSGGDEHDPAE
jgi:phosphoribosylpyrophosphate synthetase